MKNIKFLVVALVTAVLTVSVLAETYDVTVGDADGLSATLGSGRFIVYEQTVDFATRNVITNDVIQVFDIPANVLVVGGQAEVISAASTNVGANQNIHLGDGADPDRYVASLSGIALGDQCISNRQFYYTTADTIDITSLGNFSNGKVRVRVAMIDFTK